LITIRKPWGRQLQDKAMTFMATGYESQLPEGFDVPFRRTADYFHMQFKDPLYVCTNTKFYRLEIGQEKLKEFLARI
jgi:hypothetical protein